MLGSLFSLLPPLTTHPIRSGGSLLAVEPNMEPNLSSPPSVDAWNGALELKDRAQASVKLPPDGAGGIRMAGEFTVEAWFRLKVLTFECWYGICVVRHGFSSFCPRTILNSKHANYIMVMIPINMVLNGFQYTLVCCNNLS